MEYTLGKDEKLKSKIAIEQLFEQGKRIKSFPLQLVYLKKEHNGLFPYKVGFSVPKRLIKLAVDRNRLKRLMTEAYRKNKRDFLRSDSEKYIMMFVYVSKEEADYENTTKAMRKIAQKFITK